MSRPQNKNILDLSFNYIHYIKDNFHCFNSLKPLTLFNNRFKITTSTKFIAPPELRELLLHKNEITSLTQSELNCPKYENMKLCHSHLTTFR